jgi:branched-chain amino acid transport system substrate-binding protein
MNYGSKILYSLIVISFLSLHVIAPVPAEADEALIIGVLHSEEYTYATMMKNSFEMALEVINKKGGIKGRPLKLVYGNDRGKPKEGEKIINELVKKTGAIMQMTGLRKGNGKMSIG